MKKVSKISSLFLAGVICFSAAQPMFASQEKKEVIKIEEKKKKKDKVFWNGGFNFDWEVLTNAIIKAVESKLSEIISGKEKIAKEKVEKEIARLKKAVKEGSPRLKETLQMFVKMFSKTLEKNLFDGVNSFDKKLKEWKREIRNKLEQEAKEKWRWFNESRIVKTFKWMLGGTVLTSLPFLFRGGFWDMWKCKGYVLFGGLLSGLYYFRHQHLVNKCDKLKKDLNISKNISKTLRIKATKEKEKLKKDFDEFKKKHEKLKVGLEKLTELEKKIKIDSKNI